MKQKIKKSEICKHGTPGTNKLGLGSIVCVKCFSEGLENIRKDERQKTLSEVFKEIEKIIKPSPFVYSKEDEVLIIYQNSWEQLKKRLKNDQHIL